MSPAALQRPCATSGCPNLVASGRCPACTSTSSSDAQRGNATERGYGADWRKLRSAFRQMLINAGVLPVCGARLPNARPAPVHSRCAQEGRLLDDVQHARMHGTRLHTDHIIPHNGDDALRLDTLNLQLLCKDDHDRKTASETHAR